ncbi:MAG: alpha/beta hydrolase [Thermaerobacter sp.]|nr:alpha/beta hydrolase [Thermaerobacter sp.]
MRTASGVKYYVAGAGGTAILCHPSLGLGRFLFHRLGPLLAGEHTVVTWDPRGVGDQARREANLDGWVNDTLEIARAVGKPACLLGVSLGSWVVARAAVKEPEWVAGLILQGTTLGFREGASEVDKRKRQLAEQGMEVFARQYADTTLIGDNDVLRNNLAWELSQVEPNRYVEAMAEIYTVSNREVFSQLKVRTLVMAGSMDRRTSPAEADKAAAAIPGARVAIVPRAGHLAALDQPNAVAEIVRRFLGGATTFE